eukprot:11275539-Ditylum_brightwellii.AAC.1
MERYDQQTVAKKVIQQQHMQYPSPHNVKKKSNAIPVYSSWASHADNMGEINKAKVLHHMA